MKLRLPIQSLSERSVPLPQWPDRPPARSWLTSLLLLSTLLVMVIQIPVLAVTFPGQSGVPSPPADQQTFEDWLRATGKPVVSRYHGYTASFETFQNYKLLVYGRPSQVSGNRYHSRSGQYASLGYSYDEIVVTNSLFPDDSSNGQTKSSPWQWNELNLGESARISWARLDARQKTFIKSAGLLYRNNSYGGINFANLGLTESNTIVLAPPTWHLGFALYTRHYRPGTTSDLRYATFNGNGGGDIAVGCQITLSTPPDAEGFYTLARNADFIDIPYTVSGSIAALNGLAAVSDIRHCGTSGPSGWFAGTGAGPWTSAQSLRIQRSELASQPSRQFSLTGQAWAVSAMGDIRLAQAERTITVRLAPALPDFAVQVSVEGGIGYFAGQINSLGRLLPVQPHRFLALERLKISLDFNRDPQIASYTFNGQKNPISCIPGICHYEVSLIIPDIPSTLSWADQRLRAPMQLLIEAQDRQTPPGRLAVSVNDLEITGNVYDITYPQARPN